MSRNIKKVWEKCTELLKEEMTEISFNTWIADITPVNISKDTFEIGVKDNFKKNFVERYIDLIKNAVRITTNKEYDIKIVIPQDDGNFKSTIKNNKNNYNSIMSSVLNPKYTFDTFVVGNSNRFAHAASVAVSESPASSYNPLFLYGGVGLGKTHLMHAIGHHIQDNNPDFKILYVTSEVFTNELINAIKDDNNENFRNKYRNIDVLLIDDIQFIGGKERTQEEFFHTFNSLYESNKQIILSSDKTPKEINTLEDRLRSRFEWGLITDIQPPDFETRIAILKKRAQNENLQINDDVIYFIAERIQSNIRELEGSLNRIIAYSTLTDNEVSLSLAEEVMKDILNTMKKNKITPSFIMDMTARHYDIEISDLKSKNRSRNITYPRQIAMYLCRKLTGISFPKIGENFGGRDHTTVLHACEKIEEEIKSKNSTKNSVNELIKKIKG